jgi:hypothetical protein
VVPAWRRDRPMERDLTRARAFLESPALSAVVATLR